MTLASQLLMRLEAGCGGPALLSWRLFLLRIIQAMAAGLLFGHAAAYSQSAAARVAPSAAVSTASAPVVLPRTIPFKQDSSLASSDASPSLAAIALVVLSGLAGVAWWAWRKGAQAPVAEDAGKGLRWWRAMPSQKSVLLHGSTRLSPRHSVHEIEWRGRRLLIGCADQTMTLLSERAAVESPGEAIAPGHPPPVQEGDKP